MDLWHLLIGRPLKANQAQQEEIGTSEGLAALSLDALSSVAYGPEAIAVVLVTAGAGAMSLLLPITGAIVGLLVLLVISYRQVIVAYPSGGGAYAVSRENLGAGISHVAAAALIIDYILTVAVSIAAGVAELTSAFPSLLPYTVGLCLFILALVVFFNLRGVGESARAFLLPTLVFILGIVAVIVAGLLRGAPAVALPPAAAAHGVPLTTIGMMLYLRAFAAGCSALTGVEAIANGVPLFREPRVQRAQRTEFLLGLILAVMLTGLAVVTNRFHLAPQPNQTLLSEVTAAAVGRGTLYFIVSLATTMVLALAANTSFGGLPLLASILAKDHYLPHIFAIRGDRLVYVYGIWVLAISAALLLVVVRGNTIALIPLFAIGVFTGFTFSQAGMVVHWWKARPQGWKGRAFLNGLGAVVTGIATIVFILTKFLLGAWVVVAAIPLMVLLFRKIHTYYQHLGERLQIREPPNWSIPEERPLVMVPFSNLSQWTVEAIRAARALSDEVIAVTVVSDPDGDAAEQKIKAEWDQWDAPARLVVLRSQYQSVVRPLLRFIGTVERQSEDRVMVLIPEVVPRGLGQNLLHNQIGLMLASALRRRSDVIVSVMPMHWDG